MSRDNLENADAESLIDSSGWRARASVYTHTLGSRRTRPRKQFSLRFYRSDKRRAVGGGKNLFRDNTQVGCAMKSAREVSAQICDRALLEFAK